MCFETRCPHGANAKVSSCTSVVSRRRGMTHSREVQMTSFLLFNPSSLTFQGVYIRLLVEVTRLSAVLVVIISHVAVLPAVTKVVAYTTPVV